MFRINFLSDSFSAFINCSTTSLWWIISIIKYCVFFLVRSSISEPMARTRVLIVLDKLSWSDESRVVGFSMRLVKVICCNKVATWAGILSIKDTKPSFLNTVSRKSLILSLTKRERVNFISSSNSLNHSCNLVFFIKETGLCKTSSSPCSLTTPTIQELSFAYCNLSTPLNIFFKWLLILVISCDPPTSSNKSSLPIK